MTYFLLLLTLQYHKHFASATSLRLISVNNIKSDSENLLISQLDRTGLTENQFCRSDVEPFESRFHMKYTKLNCDFFENSGFSHQCSLSPYYGVNIG